MIKRTTGAALLLLAAGCSHKSPEPAVVATASAAADTAAKSLPDGEDGLKVYADCSVKIEAVGNLYDAIAKNTADAAKAASLKQTADARHETAARFKGRASALASGLGHADEPAKLMAAAKDTLDARQKGQAFQDFAVWLGSQADACAPFDPPKT